MYFMYNEILQVNVQNISWVHKPPGNGQPANKVVGRLGEMRTL